MDITQEEREQLVDYATNVSKKMITMQSLYHLFGNPDVIIGVIPIYNATMIEVTKSHQKLKYRAIGGQFLAKQRGGRYALRIDAKLPDTKSYITQKDSNLTVSSLDIITALQLLQAAGAGEEEYNFSQGSVPTRFGSKENLVNAVLDGDLQLVGDTDAEMKFIKHKTFPIITKDEMLFNMYIESLIYWRTNDRDDPNTINISILCRKYVPPPAITSINYKTKLNLDVVRDVSLNKDVLTKDGAIKIVDYYFIRDRKTVRTSNNITGYHINKIYKHFKLDTTKIEVRTKPRVPNRYEYVELVANIIHREALDGGNWLKQQVSDRGGISRLRKNLVSSFEHDRFGTTISEKSINLNTGETSDIVFSRMEEIATTLMSVDSRVILHKNTIYLECSPGNNVILLKLMYRVGEDFKSFYMNVNQYYTVEIEGITYLFLASIKDEVIKVNIWRDTLNE